MNRKFFTSMMICLFVANVSAIAQQDEVLNIDLKTALQIAADNNPTIKIADLEVQRVDYAKKEAIGGLLPNISAAGQYTDNVMKQVMFMPESFSALMGGQKYMEMGYKNSFVGTVQAQLPLVNFTLWRSIANKQNEIDIIIEKSRLSKIDMAKQIKDSYYQTLLAKSSLNVLEQSYQNAATTLKNVENSYQQGVVSEYDYIRAKVQVNNINPMLITARNGVELSLMQLKMLLSLPVDLKLNITETLESFDNQNDNLLVMDKSMIRENNSDLKLLDYNIVGLRNQLKLINTQHLPSLTMTGQYIYQTQAEDFHFKNYNWVGSASIGLALQIPIFNGLQKINQANQVKMAIKELELQADYVKTGVDLQIQSAINTMQAAKEQLEVNRDAIAQAQRGYDIAKTRYNVGSGTILELNDSELSLTQSKLNYQQALYNYLSAQADLERIKGNY